MKILKTLILFAAIVAIIGIFLPQEYSVSRELVIQAPAAELLQTVENMEGWENWTAWDEAVPPAGRKLDNVESGVGSGKYFSGPSGSGWFVIKSSSVVDGFEYTVHFDNGDKAEANVIFLNMGGDTKVTWTVKGRVEKPPVLAPYIALSKEFILGSSLRQNLSNLKKKLTQSGR